MRIGSLFAGIGGFDLAARWMGWETAWFSEIDPYASQVLAKHWPSVPNHGDITKIDFTTVEPVDLLCGGFPCQDISKCSGRMMAGIHGDRSGLWTHYARAIRELRPRYVVVENVPALFVRGFGAVIGDLAEIGYDAEWSVLSACAVGAPHMRERLWVVAHPSGKRMEGGWPPRFAFLPAHANPSISLRGASGERGTHWKAEPGVDRLVDGVPNRVDRLKGLGNAIVPQCAYAIFSAIQEAEMRAAA